MPEWRWRVLVSVSLCVGNLLSIGVLQSREWLVCFDPPVLIFLIFPTFIVGLPTMVVLLPKTTDAKLTPRAEWFARSLVPLVFCYELFWLGMLLVGTFCRDEMLNFYWPWEPRVMKITATDNISLSEYLWVNVLQRGLPENPAIREALGLTIVASHLVLVPIAALMILRGWRPEGAIRLAALFIVIAQFINLFVLKNVLHYAFDIKYLLSFPEHFLNL